MTKARELSDYTGLAADITSAGLPSTVAGSEMTWATATVPTGWLEENGAAISRSTYSALFAVLGTTFGVGDGSSTFNLPDARGEFIRGWAHGSANDPDRAARTNRGDGTTGDVVGSKQLDQFQGHWHQGAIKDSGTGSNQGFENVGSDDNTTSNSSNPNIKDPTYDGNNGGPRTGVETRGRNTNRMIIIKY